LLVSTNETLISENKEKKFNYLCLVSLKKKVRDRFSNIKDNVSFRRDYLFFLRLLLEEIFSHELKKNILFLHLFFSVFSHFNFKIKVHKYLYYKIQLK